MEDKWKVWKPENTWGIKSRVRIWILKHRAEGLALLENRDKYHSRETQEQLVKYGPWLLRQVLSEFEELDKFHPLLSRASAGSIMMEASCLLSAYVSLKSPQLAQFGWRYSKNHKEEDSVCLSKLTDHLMCHLMLIWNKILHPWEVQSKNFTWFLNLFAFPIWKCQISGLCTCVKTTLNSSVLLGLWIASLCFSASPIVTILFFFFFTPPSLLVLPVFPVTF